MSVKIHGKEYLTVAERVKMFHKENPNGSIQTELIKLEDGVCVIKAHIYPDIENNMRRFTGYAMEEMGASRINKTSYVEVCDTSAIGRGLAAAGYLGDGSEYASANEVQNAVYKQDIEKHGKITEEQKGMYQEYLKHPYFVGKARETNTYWGTLTTEPQAEKALLAMLQRMNKFDEQKAKKKDK